MTKKFLQTVLLLCFALFGQAVTAQEIVRDNIRYALTAGSPDPGYDGTAQVLGFFSVSGATANLRFNDYVVGDDGFSYYAVTSIADQAFMSNSITALTLPASITFLGNAAFMNCPALTTVTYLGTVEPKMATSVVFGAGATERMLYVPNASSGFTASLWGATNIVYGGTGTTYYTVTYLALDVYPNAWHQETVAANSLLTKPKDPVRENYTFEGWFRGNMGATTLEYLDEWNFAADKVY